MNSKDFRILAFWAGLVVGSVLVVVLTIALDVAKASLILEWMGR